jgi:hypothetical protein
MGGGLRTILGLALLLALAGCDRGKDTPGPPRLKAEAQVPVAVSRVTVPVRADLAALEARLNAEIPTLLYSIDRQEKACVPAARATLCLKHERPCKGEACRNVPCKVGFKGAKVTPTLGCRVVGEVTRGPIRLSGEGDLIRLRMPVSAEVSAKDVGRILSETATAEAEVRADIRLGMQPDWTPTAKVEIDYSWTEKPGIELLGQRFTFARRADPELAKLIRKLEADLPRELKSLHPRARLEQAWSKGFTAIELNERHPPVWMRLTPQQLGYGGYRLEEGQLVLKLELEAKAETFVGDRPADPPVAPLPPMTPVSGTPGFRVIAPVIADYAQLEPVLERALDKLAARPIEVPAVGAVKADFGTPTIYATEGGRVAIGLPIAARSAVGISTRGKVWLTGVPFNAPNSPLVKVRDLQIAGRTDNATGDLLIQLAGSPAVLGEIERAMAQDFGRDLAKLKAKIDRALTDKQLGSVVLNVRLDGIRYGVVKPLAQGAYLPVEVTGTGDLRLLVEPGETP